MTSSQATEELQYLRVRDCGKDVPRGGGAEYCTMFPNGALVVPAAASAIMAVRLLKESVQIQRLWHNPDNTESSKDEDAAEKIRSPNIVVVDHFRIKKTFQKIYYTSTHDFAL